jgi:histidyl-tRNA synthetase
MSLKPSLPSGTRDFGPAEMAKRNFILDTIRNVFKKFGFMPLETPAMEKLDILTGKYGDEGDQLLFKILNSGDFLSNVSLEELANGSRHVAPKIAEKGLKYDLTVPFARYTVMNQHNITFPFKRYQIQPVWRADRPQKGRYREFYQCDADVVGTDSLVCEAEIILMIQEVFSILGLTDYTIKLNHRKLLSSITDYIGAAGKENEFCVAIDKLDKIGQAKVFAEMHTHGISEECTKKLIPIMEMKGSNFEKLENLTSLLGSGGDNVLADISKILSLAEVSDANMSVVKLDLTLARGLSYYTGTIFEVKVNNVNIGSVSGGGRYDDLTGNFGLPGISGVGFSFGVDRLYDVLEELSLFPSETESFSDVLLVAFDDASWDYGWTILQSLRQAGLAAEIYPEPAKPKKMFGYADKKNIPFTIIIGEEERAQGILTLKDMQSGKQEAIPVSDIIERLQHGQ